MSIITSIINLKKIDNLSKHDQLVHGIIESINKGELVTGDKLPSINTMVNELGFARKTIVKAYGDLKGRGLVESKKLKGYFIVSEKTNVVLRIALLMYSFHRFQEEFYNAFRSELGKKFQIDVFFHHNNSDVFETIFSNIRAKYGMYVIAPIQTQPINTLLQTINPKKLLIVDRYLPMGSDYSFIVQEFEKSTYTLLVKLLEPIKKYDKIVLFYRDDLDYPPGTLRAFQKFLKDYNLPGAVAKTYKPKSVEKNCLYLFISDTYLWEVLMDCQQNNLSIGKDVGVLSFNDHIVKELVFGGLTTISINFKEMAIKAAKHIKLKDISQTVMHPSLTRRNSL
ncbi:GntR family transcriptional regulator [uncultured Zobellia sp.]|uniref:GntR family transcriptional regulator n=1 Tax=uncultured Zobellia sp. TaxID=255433 RepID=UPI002597DF6C|nr:GntR family transcriptional regulator [uncultured Zobellia sp.]